MVALWPIAILTGLFINYTVYILERKRSITQCVEIYSVSDLPKALRNPRWLIVEFGTVIILGFLYLKFGLSDDFLRYGSLTILMLILTLIDLDTNKVNMEVIFGGLLLGFLFVLSTSSLSQPFLGAILGGSVFGLLSLITRGKGLGTGDIYTVILIGFYLGFHQTVIMLFLSFILATLIVLLLFTLDMKNTQDKVALVPVLFLSTILTLLCGQQLVDWYIKLIFF